MRENNIASTVAVAFWPIGVAYGIAQEAIYQNIDDQNESKLRAGRLPLFDRASPVYSMLIGTLGFALANQLSAGQDHYQLYSSIAILYSMGATLYIPPIRRFISDRTEGATSQVGLVVIASLIGAASNMNYF
jgi:hypothetical protein